MANREVHLLPFWVISYFHLYPFMCICVLRDLVGIADVFYFLIGSCFGVFILYGFDLPVSVICVRRNWDSKVLDSLGRLLLFRCWRLSLGEA